MYLNNIFWISRSYQENELLHSNHSTPLLTNYLSPVTRIMFKTDFCAFRIIITLLNIRLVFTKRMKKYLKLEFVLVIITRGNLFRQFGQATNACHRLVGRCSTMLNHSTNVVILVFPEAICLPNRLERNNVWICIHGQQCAILKEFMVKYWFQCLWILENWVIDPVSILCELIWPRTSG